MLPVLRDAENRQTTGQITTYLTGRQSENRASGCFADLLRQEALDRFVAGQKDYGGGLRGENSDYHGTHSDGGAEAMGGIPNCYGSFVSSDTGARCHTESPICPHRLLVGCGLHKRFGRDIPRKKIDASV